MTEPLLIQKLNANLVYLSERQKVLAGNIANIDTPAYQAKDVKKPDFDSMVQDQSPHLEMTTSSGKHLSGTLNDNSRFGTQKDHGFTVSSTGNDVVLEDQMGKISDIGAQHQLTTTLLHKYHQLYLTAVDKGSS